MSTLDKLRQLEATQNSPQQVQPPQQNKNKGPLATVAAAIVIVLTKFKGALFLLLSKFKFLLVALKLLKLGKFGGTLITMFVMIKVYALLYGMPFAFGFVLLIFIHEMGHGVFAKIMGLPVSAPIFIPFFGAFIALKEIPKSRWVNCVIGLGGPLFGALGASILLEIAYLDYFPEQRGFLLALAHVTFAMNLFNLFPVFGLDGDRISDPLTGKQLFLSAVLLVVCAYVVEIKTNWSDPMIIFIALLLLLKAFRRRSSVTSQQNLDIVTKARMLAAPGYTPADSSTRERWLAFLAYNGLALTLTLFAGVSFIQSVAHH